VKIYMSEGAVWLLIVFYTPAVVLVLWKLWRLLPHHWGIKVAWTLTLAFLAAAFPLGDVLSTSRKMADLCPQAGIKIYRTVTVDGFLTNFGDASFLEKGFIYIEGVKPGKRIVILTKVGGEIRRQEIDIEKTPYEPKSQYEFIFSLQSGRFENRRDIGIQRSVVRDRLTGEVLGEAVAFYAYPGWVDGLTIARFGRLQWMCPSTPGQTLKMMYQVLVPRG